MKSQIFRINDLQGTHKAIEALKENYTIVKNMNGKANRADLLNSKAIKFIYTIEEKANSLQLETDKGILIFE